MTRRAQGVAHRRFCRMPWVAAVGAALLAPWAFAQSGKETPEPRAPATAPHPAQPASPAMRQPQAVAPPRTGVIAPPRPGMSTPPRPGFTPQVHPGTGSQLQSHVRGSLAPGNRIVTPMRGGGFRAEQRLSGGTRVLESTRQVVGRGTVHAIRYGNAVSGVVEHTVRPGYVSRTYVRGGRVLYARVYQQHVFQRFGRTFTYQSVVPSVAFSPAYYAWAARPWPGPVRYRWRWRSEAWYGAFGDYFTPYPTYASLDLWMTDYLLALNMRAAYDAWQSESQSEPVPDGVDSSPPSEPAPAPQTSSSAPQAPASDSASDAPASADAPPPEHSPPAITPDVKAELDAQIKLQLKERQQGTAAATEGDLPGALKAGHTLFRVISPLDVASDTPGRTCSLGANDYIERTGQMDSEGMVPVQVKLSGISDCGTGLATRISENDLEAMDSEQQEQLSNAMLAAAKSMGPNGLPTGPDTAPIAMAGGQATADPGAASTLSHLQ